MYGQRPPGPPAPPLPFQQGLSAPPHPMMQQSPLPIPPHVGYRPGHPIHQQARVQQGPRILDGQPYLHQPPPLRGSAPSPYSHPSQSSPYAAQLFQTPPQPPPPPSQGHTNYRTLGPSGEQGLRHVQFLPLPPPPTESQSFLQPPLGDSHMPPIDPPPPLPSSPPPCPPSPPPLASPLSCSGVLHVPTLYPSYLPPTSGSEEVYDSKLRSFECGDSIVSDNHNGHNATMSHDSINCVGLAGSDVGSIVKDGSLIRRSSVSSHSLPSPPMPKDQKAVQRIETLCELIVKTDPASEDMAREKEVDNPEFKFSSSGKQLGNEAELVHKYFRRRTKNKCTLEMNSNQIIKPKESPLRPTESQLNTPDSDIEIQGPVPQSPSNRCKPGSSLSNVPTDSAGILAGNYVAQHSEGSSPFFLDYASDDGGNGSEPCLEAVNPEAGHTNLSFKPSGNMETNVGSKSSYKGESESQSLYQKALAFFPSSISTKVSESSLVSKTNVENTAINSVPSPVAVKGDDAGGQLNHFVSQDTFTKEDDILGDLNIPEHCQLNRKDAKCTSPQLKVDEFGRLIRKEASDSESDDFRHTRRRAKRDRSRSLSPRCKKRRSPRRRRRSPSWSPQRRRQSPSRSLRRRRGSPSRSRSPRKKNRSRSPISRRLVDYRGEKMKWDKGRITDCLDFSRGKCHRGTSCRFLHPASDTTAESKRYKSKHRHREASPKLNHMKVQGDSNINDNINVDSTKGYLQSVNPDNDGRLLETDVDTLVSSKPVSGDGTFTMPKDSAEPVLSGIYMVQGADHQPQPVGVSVSDNISLSKPSTTVLYATAVATDQLFSSNSSSFQLPPPPVSQIMKAPSMPLSSNDYDFMQPTQSLYEEAVPGVNILAYQAPIPGQQLHIFSPSNSTMTSLPPPSQAPVAFSNIQQNHPPPRNNFPSQNLFRPHLTTLPNHSQSREFQHTHNPVQEHHRVPVPADNLLQHFAGSNLMNFPSNSYAQGNVHTHSLPPNEIYNASFRNHQFSHYQPQPYGLPYPVPHETLPQNTVSSSTRLQSDILEKDQIPRLPEFVESKIPTHYNPYASTFDQPLSLKFGPSSFRHDNEELPSGLNHLPGDGLGAGSNVSRQMSSSNSVRANPQNLPISGSDQYDPLFDSIDKSPKGLGKYDRVPKRDCIDEFGETADAEVGAVENDSPRSSPVHTENASASEIEIDQIKSPGKKKKSKDSKSVKPFRIAVAKFVKEVLKPSWRQGKMSKEAFKTIVKKTVDKVSGALKKKQIPNSPAKINKYIDSSRRKLTKLVMGYVEKYVKA